MADIVRKALFFDVDGTLMDQKGNVPESAVRALHDARQKGHLVFINSGRTYRLARFIEHFVESDGLLCGCGTGIYLDGSCVYQYLMKEETVESLREDAYRAGADLLLEGPEGTAFRTELLHEDTREIKAFVECQDALMPYAFEARYDVNKFCLQGDARSDIDSLRKKYEAFHFVDRGDYFYECVPLGHDKGTALLKALSACGIPLSEAYAFGDSTNDCEMLKTAPHAIVMGEHDPGVSELATFLTKRVEDDGIAYAMRELGII